MYQVLPAAQLYYTIRCVTKPPTCWFGGGSSLDRACAKKPYPKQAKWCSTFSTCLHAYLPAGRPKPEMLGSAYRPAGVYLLVSVGCRQSRKTLALTALAMMLRGPNR